MSYQSTKEVEAILHDVFERRCVQCEEIAPKCDNGCPTGQLCSLQTNYDKCNECPQAECRPDPTYVPPVAASSSSKPNIGAIAGGVIGGIAVIILITWLVWRFCIRDRRRQQEAEEEAEWQAAQVPPEKQESEFTMRRDARNSTHTVASMASSILTRASNVIQIAYIPGVTNRSGPQSPDVLVPPVPPIPLAHSAPPSPYASTTTEDSYFFKPSDLRDSTFTAYTDDPRNSYATRNSIAPSITPSLARSSVATTIYRNDAVINPMPATTIVRGKAAMVSVKNQGSANNSPLSTPGSETPPVPHITQTSLRQAPVQIKMPGSGPKGNGSVMSTATMGKPVALNITKKKPSISSLSSSLAPASAADPRDLIAISPARPPTASSEASESDFEDEHARSRRSLLGHDRESQITIISDSPAPVHSPFMDMSSSIGSPLRSQTRTPGNLTTVVESEENSRRGSKETKSPFGDENALR